MNWPIVISHNHALLVRIVAELFAMLRMVDVGPQSVTEKGLPPTAASSPAASAAFTLPRDLYNAIMLILIPCESAIRRLIVIAARGLALKPFV